MPIRNWIFATAFGLAFSGGALGQEISPAQPAEPSSTQQQPAEPALEPEPVALEVVPTEPPSAEPYDPAADDRTEESGQDGHLIFGDGIAQWIMAATGVAAILLSAWAVWLLSRTLEATRAAVKSADDAVAVTRDLGEAQIRAYLNCRSASYSLSKEYVAIHLEIENVGQSPAKEVHISGTAHIDEWGGIRTHPRVTRWVVSRIERNACQPVMSGRFTIEVMHFFWDTSFVTALEEDENVDSARSTFDEGNRITFEIAIRWADVFRNYHETTMFLDADIGPGPTNRLKKRIVKGPLVLHTGEMRNRIAENDTGSPDD